MTFFGRVGKIVGVLRSLDVVKTESDINQIIVRVLTPDNGLEERTILYREDVSRSEKENIVRQRFLNLTNPYKRKNVGQALVGDGTVRGGSGGSGSRHIGNRRQSNRLRNNHGGTAAGGASSGGRVYIHLYTIVPNG